MVTRLFITLCSLLFWMAPAVAAEFSADMVMTYKGEGRMTGKVFYKADKFRMDMKSQAGEMSTITRLDKNMAWSLMHQQKMYMEIPLNLKNRPMVEERMKNELERKQVGTETIEGYQAKKYLITYKEGEAKRQIYQWITDKYSFPIKTAATDGSWSQEYRNIRTGPQPDSLFEVPAGYKKFQMPGGTHYGR